MSKATKDQLDDDRLYRFARQLILPGFDEHHQIKLAQSHVLLIGAGGLGAPVLHYMVAAGIGRITVIDDDVIDRTNLNRQIIHPEDRIGMDKVTSAEMTAKAQDGAVEIIAKKTRFTAENSTELCQSIDIIVDASDNPETRYAANDAAHQRGIPLVFGGAVRMEGQVASFRSGFDAAQNCYRCVFPKFPDHELAPGCSEAGIFGAITGSVGSIMALEVVKQALLPDQPLGPNLTGKLMLFDGRYMTSQLITTEKRSDCSCCGQP